MRTRSSLGAGRPIQESALLCPPGAEPEHDRGGECNEAPCEQQRDHQERGARDHLSREALEERSGATEGARRGGVERAPRTVDEPRERVQERDRLERCRQDRDGEYGARDEEERASERLRVGPRLLSRLE